MLFLHFIPTLSPKLALGLGTPFLLTQATSGISRESSTSLVCIEAGAPNNQIVKTAGLGGRFSSTLGAIHYPLVCVCKRGRGNAYSNEMIPPVVAPRILSRVSVVHSSCQ